ncbi:MAG: peptide-methionine (S)-S-oxide reductase MsrA [Candidatus Micrarchaeales archaeon]
MKNEIIVFGGGCFWCTEAVFEMFKGVSSTTPGYAGGNVTNPTYDDVCVGNTGHAEVLQIEYDPKIIEFDTLLEVFFTMHDPTTLNRQGADSGTQYRSIILYTAEEQKTLSEKFIKNIQKDYSKPIVTEVKKLDKFYPAEQYHMKYYDKNPDAGYCSIVIGPKVQKVKKKFAELLK